MKVSDHMQLKYKNFSGLIGYSQADGYYFGRILDIPELITFKAKTENGLKNAFYDAVDNYLFMHNDTCIIPSCRLLLGDFPPPSKERTPA